MNIIVTTFTGMNLFCMFYQTNQYMSQPTFFFSFHTPISSPKINEVRTSKDAYFQRVNIFEVN